MVKKSASSTKSTSSTTSKAATKPAATEKSKSQSSTVSSPATTATPPVEHRNSKLSSRLKDLYYAVWSLIGIVLLIMAGVAVFGGDSWTQNLNITDSSTSQQQTTQQPPQPPQPQQPTEEQLNCVSDEVGEERFEELQLGEQPTQDETAVIQECLGT